VVQRVLFRTSFWFIVPFKNGKEENTLPKMGHDYLIIYSEFIEIFEFCSSSQYSWIHQIWLYVTKCMLSLLSTKCQVCSSSSLPLLSSRCQVCSSSSFHLTEKGSTQFTIRLRLTKKLI